MPSPLLVFDADQQTSAVDKETPQNDRWRTEQITPRHAPAFTLLAVADGEGAARPGETAALALDVAFAEARARRDEPLPDLLQHVLEQMNNVVRHRGSGDTVGATLAVVQENAVWVAQAGSQTRCYRVRGRAQAVPLTTDNELPLGHNPSPMTVPAVSRRLKPGDKLVLCSDGLYAAGLVSPADMAKIDRYDDIKGAARHLSALAMGRNVRDNVTVLVASYGRSRRLPIRRLIYVLLAALGAALIIGLLGFFLVKFLIPPDRPRDRGAAVLAEGDTIEAQELSEVYPGTDLHVLPDGPVHLIPGLPDSQEPSIISPIPGIDLYFGPGSHLKLAAADIEGFTDPPVGLENPVNLTELELYSGQALIISRSTQTFYVWLGASQDPRVPRIILQGEDAALGVEHQNGQARVSCLRGSCSIGLGRRSVDIPPGTSLSLETGTAASLASSTSEAVSGQELEAWEALCSAFDSSLETASAACRALAP